MTALLAGRLAVLAWSWRRVLFAVLVACVIVPLVMAGVVVEAQRGHPAALALPVRAGTLTQPFGCTALDIEPWSGACPGHHFHSGVDLAAPMDTPVYAAAPGMALVQRERGGYGLHILVARDARLSTLYAHLDFPLVRTGDQVVAGQLIALLGSTGNSTGPHLHFEVRIAGVPVDPLPLLPALSQGLGGFGRRVGFGT